jgi:hypothetical protein
MKTLKKLLIGATMFGTFGCANNTSETSNYQKEEKQNQIKVTPEPKPLGFIDFDKKGETFKFDQYEMSDCYFDFDTSFYENGEIKEIKETFHDSRSLDFNEDGTIKTYEVIDRGVVAIDKEIFYFYYDDNKELEKMRQVSFFNGGAPARKEDIGDDFRKGSIRDFKAHKIKGENQSEEVDYANGNFHGNYSFIQQGKTLDFAYSQNLLKIVKDKYGLKE